MLGTGLVGRWLLPPGPSRTLAPVAELAERLVEALPDDVRRVACLPYDHPLRQYHNRGVALGGYGIAPWSLDRGTRSILNDLFHAALSPAGRSVVPRQYFVRWPGIHLMHFYLCGDPARPPWQLSLSGPHLNLRVGGVSAEGVAFGGPQVWGDQRGNGTFDLPGNVYRYQLEQATRFFEALSAGERERARRGPAPIQTDITLQGTNGRFVGVAVAELSPDKKRHAQALVDGLLANWRREDVDVARACLAANGGIDGLFASHYASGEEGPAGPYQIHRLEGPGAVFYFRGHPHVHAFCNIALDGNRPLSVGAEVGFNPAPLFGARLRAYFEDVLRACTTAELAYYEADSLGGSLRGGAIRSGDLYDLESWGNQVAVVEVLGASLWKPCLDSLSAAGVEIDPARIYTVAVTDWLAKASRRRLRRIVTPASGARPLLRDALIAHSSRVGFPAAPESGG